ncbi:MAG: pyridoxal 5'-phosphate synthase glutaminase subunit PdxT [Euryarchaeota archaeon]|nr:pyridoxal 5'-phosphate synthase glutaminase subunit PdxT [Euryarchaeota archaeon]
MSLGRLERHITTRPLRIGVAALQGAVSEHADALRNAADRTGLHVQVFPVRSKADFEATDALVLPGGESTTISKLLVRFDLMERIRTRVADENYPILGTCAGMVLLARDGGEQAARTRTELIGVMDIAVDRNAFGRQRESFERDISLDLVGLEAPERPVPAVFIRAPAVTRTWGDARAIAHTEDRVVGAQEGRRIALSFHPELTADTRVHEAFLKLV